MTTQGNWGRTGGSYQGHGYGYGHGGNYGQTGSYGRGGGYSQSGSYGHSGNYGHSGSYGHGGGYGHNGSYGRDGSYGHSGGYGHDSGHGGNYGHGDSWGHGHDGHGGHHHDDDDDFFFVGVSFGFPWYGWYPYGWYPYGYYYPYPAFGCYDGYHAWGYAADPPLIDLPPADPPVRSSSAEYSVEATGDSSPDLTMTYSAPAAYGGGSNGYHEYGDATGTATSQATGNEYRLGHDWGQDVRHDAVTWDEFVAYVNEHVSKGTAAQRDEFRRGFIAGYGSHAEAALDKAMQEGSEQTSDKAIKAPSTSSQPGR